jgi:hypothetical protein
VASWVDEDFVVDDIRDRLGLVGSTDDLRTFRHFGLLPNRDALIKDSKMNFKNKKNFFPKFSRKIICQALIF